jgi:hypothetical protein
VLVTVPDREMPLTVPVPLTDVTVPPLFVLLMVWLGQDPVTVTLVPATNDGVVVPVPPDATGTGLVKPEIDPPVIATLLAS